MLEVVQYMIATKSKVESRNSDRQTALLLACSAGHTDVVQYLLKCKYALVLVGVFWWGFGGGGGLEGRLVPPSSSALFPASTLRRLWVASESRASDHHP